MDQLAALLSKAVTQRHAPFLVGMLGDSKGVFWTGSAGANEAGIELNERTVFRIVSMTKGVGATGNRLVPMCGRSLDGGFSAVPIDVAPPAQPEFYGMGHALYSTASDYMRFLRMWMNQGQLDGVRVLEQHSVEHLLSNQIGDLRLRPLRTALPLATHDLVVESGFEVSHSLGFARMEDSIPGRRSEGSQFWGGVLNTHFWMDTEKDLVGILMTQLLPFLDPHFMRLLFDFERAAYASTGPRQ